MLPRLPAVAATNAGNAAGKAAPHRTAARLVQCVASDTRNRHQPPATVLPVVFTPHCTPPHPSLPALPADGLVWPGITADRASSWAAGCAPHWPLLRRLTAMLHAYLQACDAPDRSAPTASAVRARDALLERIGLELQAGQALFARAPATVRCIADAIGSIQAALVYRQPQRAQAATVDLARLQGLALRAADDAACLGLAAVALLGGREWCHRRVEERMRHPLDTAAIWRELRWLNTGRCGSGWNEPCSHAKACGGRDPATAVGSAGCAQTDGGRGSTVFVSTPTSDGRSAIAANAADAVAPNRAWPEFLRTAVSCMTAFPLQGWSIERTALSVGVSARRLREAFRVHLGCSPKCFEQRARLDAARAYIGSGQAAEHRISDIAARFGFSHAGRFSALYRQAYGRGPAEEPRVSS
jgi:AraC-like DNA-binding protein